MLNTSVVRVPPPPITDVGVYLGCLHAVGTTSMHGRKVRTMTYGMDASFEYCCDLHRLLSPPRSQVHQRVVSIAPGGS